MIGIILLTLLFIAGGCRESGPKRLPADQKLSLANTYYNNELYEAAVREYKEYLEQYEVDTNKQANTWYIIANIYFERLKDYNKALEYYLRVKHLYPQSSLQADVGKRIVNCLERLQRSTDARRVLDRETALKADKISEHRPGAIVARIGNKTITQGDLDFEIDQLPQYMRGQFDDAKKKMEFLKQFIVQELLYDSARRKGLDKDKDVVEGTFRAKKGLMAQKLLSEEISKMVDIKEADVELYYKANLEKYAEKDDKGKVVRQKSLQEVAQQVANDLLRERQQKAYDQLIDRLMKAEKVEIFEKRIH